MESLGDKLRSARENKAYSHDFVSRETNISSRYIKALEIEDFSCFPSELYILGFLKTYSSFLELDPGEIQSIYRAHKIQQQPLPMTELVKGPSQLHKILGIIFVSLAVLGLIGAGVWFFLRFADDDSGDYTFVHIPVEYTLSTGSLERRFYQGDTVLVSLDGNSYKLELLAIGDAVSLATPYGITTLDLGQDATLDFNNDGIQRLRIILADFSKNNTYAGALLNFEVQTFTSLLIDTETEILQFDTDSTVSQRATVIINSPNPYPFTLQAAFQGFCLFRWEIIAERDRQGKNEQFLQRGDERTISAQNGIRIGVSNAQAVRLNVIGGGRQYPLELGSSGEIAVADIRWLRDEDNRFRLVLMHLE